MQMYFQTNVAGADNPPDCPPIEFIVNPVVLSTAYDVVEIYAIDGVKLLTGPSKQTGVDALAEENVTDTMTSPLPCPLTPLGSETVITPDESVPTEDTVNPLPK